MHTSAVMRDAANLPGAKTVPLASDEAPDQTEYHWNGGGYKQLLWWSDEFCQFFTSKLNRHTGLRFEE